MQNTSYTMKKYVFVFAIVSLIGCVPEQQLSKQKELETNTTKISQDIEDIKKQLRRIDDRLDRLEVQQPPVKSATSLYTTAETFYTKKNYKEAILAFQRFIDIYPKDVRVPSSYLKQGISLINLGKKEEAKFFFKTVIDKFPESEEAKKAQQILKKIG